MYASVKPPSEARTERRYRLNEIECLLELYNAPIGYLFAKEAAMSPALHTAQEGDGRMFKTVQEEITQEEGREKELWLIAQELHDIVAQRGVTLIEAESIYSKAGRITRNAPEIQKLLHTYHNVPITSDQAASGN